VLLVVSAAAYGAAAVHLQLQRSLAGSKHVRQYTRSLVDRPHAEECKRAHQYVDCVVAITFTHCFDSSWLGDLQVHSAAMHVYGADQTAG
jgi:hypothetical protein